MKKTVNYTNMNHFKFGYDGKWFIPRTSRYQKWMCEYGTAEKQLSIKEANRQAALEIQKNAEGKQIYLLLSGGADSEVAARSFIDANVPFTAVILKYKIFENDAIVNQEETIHADQLCEQYNIPKKEFFMYPEKFWNSDEYLEIVSISQTRSPQLACTMWLAKQVDGYVVLGQGEPFIYRQFGEWWFRERELIVSWYKFWVFSGISGAPGFHQYTPEQLLAYLTDPEIIELVNNPKPSTIDGPLSNADIKHKLYQKHYPESNLNSKKKYTGFENLVFLETVARMKLIEQFPFCADEFVISYKDMLLNLKASYSAG
jgi:hypothetical protein